LESSDSFLDLCRKLALVVRRDDLIRRPSPNVFDNDRLAQVYRIGHGCREPQGLSVLRACKALDHSQLVAMRALPGGSACQDPGRFDDQRVAFPTADGISEPARRLVGRTFAPIRIDGALSVPLAVSQFKAVFSSLADFELMPRNKLLSESIRLA